MTQNNHKPHLDSKYLEELDKISEEDNNFFSPVLRDVSKIVDYKNSRILDVGCGTGLFLKSIINSGCKNCFGVDGPTQFAERAIQRGYKEVFIVDDLSSCPLPFQEESFDFVVCKDVFEHLLDPVYALESIKGVLKKDGYFLLHVPNHFPLLARLKFLFSNNIDTFSFFKSESRWTYPHIRFYEYKDSLSVLSQHGFILEMDLSWHFPAFSIFSRFKIFHPFINYFVRKFPNQFAAGYTFLLSKRVRG